MSKWKYEVTSDSEGDGRYMEVRITSPSGIEMHREFAMDDGGWPDVVHILIQEMALAGFTMKDKKS